MNWYEKRREAILKELKSDAQTGLKIEEIAQRQTEYGKNQFDEQKEESILRQILRNLRDISTIILIFAAFMSLFMGLFAESSDKGFVEFVVIISIVILNLILAITQERSAEKSLNALKSMNSPTTVVLRGGKQEEIDSVDVVPGDVIVLKAGNLVSADARLLESNNLFVDESILTGESEPAEKDAEEVLEGKVLVADQHNMVFSGCLVTAGRATAVVTGIGMQTQMGRIASFLNNSQRQKTPLQNRLDRIGKFISMIAIFSAVIMFGIGFFRGAEAWDMIFVAISLAVAAVPETLSLIVTLILTHGVTEMVKKNALIRKLPAVETLGSTSVICSDKTGTLTQNKMAIKRLWCENGEPFAHDVAFTPEQSEMLNRFVLASNAVLEKTADGEITIIGDPTERAIIQLFDDLEGDRNVLDEKYPRVMEIPFSSERKMMTTIHKCPDGRYLVLTKGAFDRVPFEAASEERVRHRHDIHGRFAADALRVIALGSRYISSLPAEDKIEEVEADLCFEGIIGIIDPPRPEAAKAISNARKAGIRTVMITGDHPATAGAIARELGLTTESGKIITGLELSEMSDDELIENVPEYAVYARVSPEDKIRIVEAWQEHEEVVAMTGDGVNDAPALKAADVGVAMGINGTEVSKSASDMILTDDNFSTIVSAIHQGRNVFSNIRKTIYFLLVCNFSEIIIMLGAQLIDWGIPHKEEGLPLTPIMLLLINVVGDGIPGLQLARERSDPRIMQRKPIGRNESLFEGLQNVLAQQTIAFVIVAWIGFYLGRIVNLHPTIEPSLVVGQTMCFLIVGWTSIVHVFTVRSRQSIFRRTIKDNPPLVISAVCMVVLFALFVLIPPFAGIFGMVAIGWTHWLIVLGLSVVPTIVAEIGKFISNHSSKVQYRDRLVQHHDRED